MPPLGRQDVLSSPDILRPTKKRSVQDRFLLQSVQPLGTEGHAGRYDKTNVKPASGWTTVSLQGPTGASNCKLDAERYFATQMDFFS